ncbi:MAG: tRNA (N(6)-L-threonylcarbamoyladenosine(37)-C(2))-methylthiotransferase MtaB [Clostridia bacterium]
MRVSVFNLGCKVNQYEGDELIAKLKARGEDAFEGFEKADVYIINTCAVTNEAEKKSRQAIARARKYNPQAKILVCGCASQRNGEQFLQLPNVTYVKGVANKADVVEHLYDIVASKNVEALPKIYKESGYSYESNTRANIKICDGCNNFCSYCIVPYLRGRTRSRNVEDIKNEFEAVKQNHKEVVLTGIDISAYGIDIGSNLTILSKSLGDNVTRIRFGSLEVRVITEEFLIALSENKSFCDHFHLSLQSGSESVLKRMNRHYKPSEYAKAVEMIRKVYPCAAITTDIIAGFPTETEQEHKETLQFAKEIGFSDIHVFEYSIREGTVAASMEQVDDIIKKCRTNDLIELKTQLKNKYIRSNIGNEMEVLFEENCGYTSNYIRVYCDGAKEGEKVKVKLIEPYKDGVKGIIIKNR